MLLPPQPLIAGCMVLLMVNGAERYREFVADLEPKAPGLGEADVMGVARRSPANETGLLGHEAQMLLGADPFWFTDGERADLCAYSAVGSRRQTKESLSSSELRSQPGAQGRGRQHRIAQAELHGSVETADQPIRASSSGAA